MLRHAHFYFWVRFRLQNDVAMLFNVASFVFTGTLATLMMLLTRFGKPADDYASAQAPGSSSQACGHAGTSTDPASKGHPGMRIQAAGWSNIQLGLQQLHGTACSVWSRQRYLLLLILPLHRGLVIPLYLLAVRMQGGAWTALPKYHFVYGTCNKVLVDTIVTVMSAGHTGKCRSCVTCPSRLRFVGEKSVLSSV